MVAVFVVILNINVLNYGCDFVSPSIFWIDRQMLVVNYREREIQPMTSPSLLLLLYIAGNCGVDAATIYVQLWLFAVAVLQGPQKLLC